MSQVIRRPFLVLTVGPLSTTVLDELRLEGLDVRRLSDQGCCTMPLTEVSMTPSQPLGRIRLQA